MLKKMYQNPQTSRVAFLFMIIIWGSACNKLIEPQTEIIFREREVKVVTPRDPKISFYTNEFGPTIIDTKQLPIISKIAEAPKKPWSAWWYPKRESEVSTETAGTLISALRKYDKYRRAKYGDDLESASAYEISSFNNLVQPWEGLCDAWALSGILAKEPKHPVVMSVGSEKLAFSISDLKALMLKTFEGVNDGELIYYGQRFSGDSSAWNYPDILPDQFHRFIEIQLFEKRQPFIMDHAPGLEVWNVPVYKANYTIREVPGNPDLLAVKLWLFSAESTTSAKRNSVGTREGVREYNYTLHGKRDSSGLFVVDSGEWTIGSDGVDSISNHPDFITVIPPISGIKRKSYNPEIDPNVVDEILQLSY